MELKLSVSEELTPVCLEKIGAFILSIQKENGEIPWSIGGKTDPWDHVESAMGLTTGGFYTEAARAYEWLAVAQLEDGSWWSETLDGKIVNSSKESNFSSYVAVGVFHHYLVTRDLKYLKKMWHTVSQGIQFAVNLQAPEGEIYWARNKSGAVDKMALLTGSSSIYMSIKCALAIAKILGKKRPGWHKAMDKLGHAIQNRPDLFNMIKSRYSMDWYYPVLCGAITGGEARKRVSHLWEKFVVPDWGVRCVSDRPWVTMAETAEFILTLAAIEDLPRARTIFSWLNDKRFSDGSFWMGVTFPDGVIWPEEKTAWTAAAAMLAWDALNEITPAGKIFNHRFWSSLNK
ncbi:MAG: hypothetical protein QMD11_05830 [Smithella sp.]|nr:hypothetical protein [Smithella sp.]